MIIKKMTLFTLTILSVGTFQINRTDDGQKPQRIDESKITTRLEALKKSFALSAFGVPALFSGPVLGYTACVVDGCMWFYRGRPVRRLKALPRLFGYITIATAFTLLAKNPAHEYLKGHNIKHYHRRWDRIINSNDSCKRDV